MPRWMMKFQVESHLGVKEELTSVSFKHPDGNYEIHLQNHDMRPGLESQILNAFVAFSYENIDEAANIGHQYLTEFLDVLGFTTSVRYTIKCRVAIYDWTVGISDREGRIYHHISDPNWPILELDINYSSTTEALLGVTKSEPIRRALRWFRVAVSAERPDEQFQWFWFVIETVAALSSDNLKVPDRCSRCHEPLYCSRCQEITTHRPYPAQLIEQLFKNHVADDPDRAYRECSAMRHALLHGENVKNIENKYNTTLSTLIDRVGVVAWASLLKQLDHSLREMGQSSSIDLLRRRTFVHRKLEAEAHATISIANQGELTISDFPGINVTLSAE